MSLTWALATDVGLHRANNEDSAQADPARNLFAIADGMGGHVAGEVASQVAIQSVMDAAGSTDPPRTNKLEEALLYSAVCLANDAVRREASARSLDGMGTTLTVARVRKRTLVVGHVGDTRVYFVQPDRMQQLTRDDTMVAMLVEAGTVKADETHLHPERHLLTQAIGTQDIVEPLCMQKRIPRGARILLSTDGLHDVVPPFEIHQLAAAGTLETAARSLIAAANANGGPDNITVLLIDPE